MNRWLDPFDASAVRRMYDDTAEAIASVVSLRSVLPRHPQKKIHHAKAWSHPVVNEAEVSQSKAKPKRTSQNS